MHNTDSFIEEVSEAVRRDRVARTMSRYGWLIAAAVVVLVGGAAVNEWLKFRDARDAAAAGDAVRAALAETDPKTRADALAALAASTPDSAVVARLAEAGSLAKAGDTDAAGALLATVAEDGATPEPYRSLAALERVMVLDAKMDATERAATLDALAQPDAPFRPLALEQRALMKLEAGDNPGAIADLQAILTEPAATEGLQGRARQLVIAAGGSLPAPVSVPAPQAVPAIEPADG